MVEVGSEFQVRLIKGQSEVMVEMSDFSPVPDDRFIKCLYAKLSKQIPSSTSKPGVVDRVSGVAGKLDKRKDLVMPGEGAPDMEADISDDTSSKVLPQARVCQKCGTSYSSESDCCGKCGHLLVGCPICGLVPEGRRSFCTKCGSPLN